MKIDKMITKRKCFDLLSNSLNELFREMYSDLFGEFESGYWGFKKCECFVTAHSYLQQLG